MAFYKKTNSNILHNEIVEVIVDKSCEKCDAPLNMLSSKNGEVKCHKCGWNNSMTENNNNE